MKTNVIYLEDCKETMKKMDANSLPFIITDPPYLLEFMGKSFDSQHRSHEGENIGQKMQKWHEEWVREAYRVLKPGGYLVAFGGTRTYHRLASAMEDVGFEIRDTLMWLYGSGFPKSLNISKGIDKRKGAEREVVGQVKRGDVQKAKEKGSGYLADPANRNNEKQFGYGVEDITKPATDEAKKWEGWGTGLKPAYEPIVIGMKALSSSFVDNALNEGVAGMNIDASRVATDKKVDDMLRKVERNERQSKQWREGSGFKNEHNELTGVREDGRFPANVILQHHSECVRVGTKKVKGITGGGRKKSPVRKSGVHTEYKGHQTIGREQSYIDYADENGKETIEDYECHEDCPVRIMNEQSGNSSSPKEVTRNKQKVQPGSGRTMGDGWNNEYRYVQAHGDFGGAARFYYTAKASKGERNVGLEGMKKDFHRRDDGQTRGMVTSEYRPDGSERKEVEAQENFHPTVKPLDLMRYLVNMFSTPDGGVVYDPFAGSASTLIACKILGREYIGSEMEKDYYEIAKKRLQYDWVTWWNRGKKDDFVKVKEEIKNKFFE
jgi:DNA modification methylase